jgi:DNA-binding NtrC family response regulator
MSRLVDVSGAMEALRETIRRAAMSDRPVLVIGPTGSGKELVVEALHTLGPHPDHPMLDLNCGAIPEALMESQLFGHAKGAFTGADREQQGYLTLVKHGTLFLDEVAELPPALQAKLLRVLETGELERVGSSQTRRVDVRVLSATNSKLHEEATAGNFREDLLFRLNTVEIDLPALRDRREDIPLLASHFLNKARSRYRKQVTGFSPAAMQQMMQYPWPGNVRELEHTVERAVLLCRGDEIEPANLAITSTRSSMQSFENMSIDEVEALLIRKVLRRCDGNISQAAEALGLSRAALYRRIEKYGL